MHMHMHIQYFHCPLFYFFGAPSILTEHYLLTSPQKKGRYVKAFAVFFFRSFAKEERVLFITYMHVYPEIHY